jgi:hypothetical protein
MARLIAPDRTIIGTDVEGARTGHTVKYDRDKDGTFHVENPNHVRALRETGYTLAGVGAPTVKQAGWVCQGCGFVSWFKTCSRCGGTGVRESEHGRTEADREGRVDLLGPLAVRMA